MHQHLHTGRSAFSAWRTAKQPRTACVLQVQLPPFSFSGDLILELDGGQKFQAHSLFLVHHSSVLAEATALAKSSSSAETCPLRVKVPCVSARQACLLLQVCLSLVQPSRCRTDRQASCLSSVVMKAVYSHMRERWCSSQSVDDLTELASTAHRLNCSSILQLVDEALGECSACLQAPCCLDSPALLSCVMCMQWSSVQQLPTLRCSSGLAP